MKLCANSKAFSKVGGKIPNMLHTDSSHLFSSISEQNTRNNFNSSAKSWVYNSSFCSSWQLAPGLREKRELTYSSPTDNTQAFQCRTKFPKPFFSYHVCVHIHIWEKVWLKEYLQTLTLPKKLQATYGLLCSPKTFYTPYSISHLSRCPGKIELAKLFLSANATSLWGFFLPKVIRSHNSLLL